MTVKIGKSGAAQASDIAALENVLGAILPSGFKEFLALYNGAEPETNIFKINEVNDSGVNRFIPAHQVLAEREKVDEFSPRSFPIAWAEGGNYVLIDLDAAGSVHFWDHETGEFTKLADDFEGFLAILQPFNIDDIELKPGQVKSVWVDPDFLKQFRHG